MRSALRGIGSAALVGSAGCTVLGPMPAVTGQSVAPASRPGIEAQAAAVPGYYLSQAVQETPKGTPIGQASLMVEPGEWIGAPGLSAGARYVGKREEGGYLEPMVRYRSKVDEENILAVGAVAHGTHATGEAGKASYSATRAGAELGADVRATPGSKWIELHFLASLGLTGLWAQGEYCLDGDGRYGVDCGDPPTSLTRAEATGAYPAAGGGISLDGGRHLTGTFHGLRLAALGAIGRMPRVVGGEQRTGKTYAAAGLSITLGLGASEP